MNNSKDDNFKRVFIHELGHFVSNWIIFELISQYKPHSIVLNTKDENSFWGKVDFKNRTDMPAKRYFPGAVLYDFESTISTLYGCFFQSIFEEKDSFKECLNCIDGQMDGAFFCGAAKTYNKNLVDLEIILTEHYDKLSNSSLADMLKNFDFTSYYQNAEYIYYYVDLIKDQQIINVKNVVEPLLIEVYEKLKTTPQK